MQLYEFDSHHRETAALWRLVRTLPLHFGLADGRIFRWWAINIPLNLLPSSHFVGDLDLMMCLLSTPMERPAVFFKTWEAKLILVSKEGRARIPQPRSETERILNQLKIQRRFGSPETSLLELYLHESGSLPVIELLTRARDSRGDQGNGLRC